jgi:hypothetical protein
MREQSWLNVAAGRMILAAGRTIKIRSKHFRTGQGIKVNLENGDPSGGGYESIKRYRNCFTKRIKE